MYQTYSGVSKFSNIRITLAENFLPDIAKSSGQPTNTQAELKVQEWYYAFQLIQVFLVTSLSSAAASIATQIAQNPSAVPEILGRQIPKASNFYLTYFILQGTASAAKNVLNYSDLFS